MQSLIFSEWVKEEETRKEWVRKGVPRAYVLQRCKTNKNKLDTFMDLISRRLLVTSERSWAGYISGPLPYIPFPGK